MEKNFCNQNALPLLIIIKYIWCCMHLTVWFKGIHGKERSNVAAVIQGSCLFFICNTCKKKAWSFWFHGYTAILIPPAPPHMQIPLIKVLYLLSLTPISYFHHESSELHFVDHSSLIKRDIPGRDIAEEILGGLR